jgi:membrane protease YdiL (CAAX protease family)
MYWHWIVAAMTFAGGLVFALAYKRPEGFLMALALHAVAGWAIFGAWLGVLFYSGNVVRPF